MIFKRGKKSIRLLRNLKNKMIFKREKNVSDY